MGEIFYKGEKYGGENQDIKAINIDTYFENKHFETPEEAEAFLNEFNTTGIITETDSDGYIVVPVSNDIYVENAVVIDDSGSGIIVNRDPDEVQVQINNGVEKIYSNSSTDTFISQGLRCLCLPLPVSSSSYKIARLDGDTDTFPHYVVCADATTQSYCETIRSLKARYEAASGDLNDDQQLGYNFVKTLADLMDSGDIEKYIYSDCVLLTPFGSGTGQFQNILQSIYYVGQDNDGYVYRMAGKNGYNNAWQDKEWGHTTVYNDFKFAERPELLGIILIANKIEVQHDTPMYYDTVYTPEAIDSSRYYLKNINNVYAYDRNKIIVHQIYDENDGRAYMYYPIDNTVDNKTIFKKLYTTKYSSTGLSETIYTQLAGGYQAWLLQVKPYPIALKKVNGKYEQILFKSTPIYDSNIDSTVSRINWSLNPTPEEYQVIASLQSKTQPMDWPDRIREQFGD